MHLLDTAAKKSKVNMDAKETQNYGGGNRHRVLELVLMNVNYSKSVRRSRKPLTCILFEAGIRMWGGRAKDGKS